MYQLSGAGEGEARGVCACAVDHMQPGVDGGGEGGGKVAVENPLDPWRHEQDDADADDVGGVHLADALVRADGVHAVF